jgi:hypothetical protein
MNARIDRLRKELAERAEREGALPAALCATCGGKVRAGEGTRAPEPEFDTATERSEYEFWCTKLPAGVDRWRRTCSICAAAEAGGRMESVAVSAVLGRAVGQVDAAAVVRAVTEFDLTTGRFVGISARSTGRATGKPWGHLTEDDRERIRAALQDVVTARTAGPCTDGACGICGVRQAIIWRPSRLLWRDGKAAPLCDACSTVWRMRGEPIDPEDVRRVAVECLTGKPVALGNSAPREFRAYYEHPDCDGNGTAERFGYSPRLREYAEEVWTASPQYAPENRRAEFEERRRLAHAEREAQIRQEWQSQQAAVW